MGRMPFMLVRIGPKKGMVVSIKALPRFDAALEMPVGSSERGNFFQKCRFGFQTIRKACILGLKREKNGINTGFWI